MRTKTLCIKFLRNITKILFESLPYDYVILFNRLSEIRKM